MDNTITIKHDSLRQGVFPLDKLNEIEGIHAYLDNKARFVETYKIVIDMTNENQPIQDIACELGMMIQSYIMTEQYLKM